MSTVSNITGTLLHISTYPRPVQLAGLFRLRCVRWYRCVEDFRSATCRTKENHKTYDPLHTHMYICTYFPRLFSPQELPHYYNINSTAGAYLLYNTYGQFPACHRYDSAYGSSTNYTRSSRGMVKLWGQPGLKSCYYCTVIVFVIVTVV